MVAPIDGETLGSRASPTVSILKRPSGGVGHIYVYIYPPQRLYWVCDVNTWGFLFFWFLFQQLIVHGFANSGY